MDECADDRWALDLGVLSLALADCPFVAPLRAVYPEISSRAEPVKGVVAAPKITLVAEDFFCNRSVAAVVADYRADAVTYPSHSSFWFWERNGFLRTS